MTPVVVTTFLATLALGAAAVVLLTLVVMAMDRLGLGGAMDALRAIAAPAALWLAALVAVVAMAGSLYLSEVAGYVPCALCWYQRIAMYPLVVILAVAAWRRDAGVARYAGPVAGIGALISVYHVAVQRMPGLPTGACSLDAPCDLIYVERFGFVTIPVMALIGFLSILTLLLLYADHEPELELEPEPDA